MRDWPRLVRSAIGATALTAAVEQAVVEELAQHLEDRYRHLRSQGWTEDEAVERSLGELDGEELMRRLADVSGAC